MKTSEFLKKSPIIRKTLGHKQRNHHKSLRKRLMPKNPKPGPEEETFSHHCVQNVQKDERKKSEPLQETCRSAAMIQNLGWSARLWNDLKNDWNRIHIFDEKFSPLFLSSTIRIIWPKRLGIMSLNTAECQQPHPASSMMLGFIERREDAANLVWMGLKADLCRLQRSVEEQTPPWVNKTAKKSDCAF